MARAPARPAAVPAAAGLTGLRPLRGRLRPRLPRLLRLLPLALLCLLVAPGTWLRERPIAPGDGATLVMHRLDLSQPRDWPAALRVAGGWSLGSRHEGFGGYSTLLALPGNRLLSFSDRGDFLEFAAPDGPSGPTISGTVPEEPDSDNLSYDFESATRDPETSRIWLGLEGNNAIRRLNADKQSDGAVRRDAMAGWARNRGPEAMTRLADGRFIVLAEGSLPGDSPSPGVLFSGDPVAGAQPVAFDFPRRGGYRPTDMAALPDGRVIILFRKLALGLPPFGAMLAIADPATIRPGRPWDWRPLAELAPPLPRENYEGIAVRPAADGGVDLWIIADNNQGGLQRTLLLKLHWTGLLPSRP